MLVISVLLRGVNRNWLRELEVVLILKVRDFCLVDIVCLNVVSISENDEKVMFRLIRIFVEICNVMGFCVLIISKRLVI